MRITKKSILKKMPITIADEGLHPAGKDADWQESVYLSWRDSRAGLGGNHRLGNELNRGTANLWCGVYRDDGTRFRGNGEDLPLERLAAHGVAAGPQRLFHDGKSLRFRLDAEGCRIDFEIEDDERSFTDADAQAFAGSSGAAGSIFTSHFNACCRARGTVELDGHTAEVDAPAWRDHSWGVRRWDSFTSSRSFGGSLGSLEFRFGSMVGANGSFFRRGTLIRDGEPVEVTRAEMLVSVDDDSLRCPAAEVRYHLANGTVTTVRIDVIGGMLGVTRQRCGWESVGDTSVDGKPGGWGFLEVNLNPRSGSAVPAFALVDALTNGIVRPA
jgi:hypothetical protein